MNKKNQTKGKLRNVCLLFALLLQSQYTNPDLMKPRTMEALCSHNKGDFLMGQG